MNQDKALKQGIGGRECKADNIFRDLKEMFSPPWELASPTEGNAAQPPSCLPELAGIIRYLNLGNWGLLLLPIVVDHSICF